MVSKVLRLVVAPSTLDQAFFPFKTSCSLTTVATVWSYLVEIGLAGDGFQWQEANPSLGYASLYYAKRIVAFLVVAVVRTNSITA